MKNAILHDSLQIRDDDNYTQRQIRSLLICDSFEKAEGISTNKIAKGFFTAALEIVDSLEVTDENLRFKSSLHHATSHCITVYPDRWQEVQAAIQVLINLQEKSATDENNLLTLILKFVRLLPSTTYGDFSSYGLGCPNKEIQQNFIPMAIEIVNRRNLISDLQDKILLHTQFINILELDGNYKLILQYIDDFQKNFQRHLPPYNYYKLLEQKFRILLKACKADPSLLSDIEMTGFELLNKTDALLPTSNLFFANDVIIREQTYALHATEKDITRKFLTIFEKLLFSARDAQQKNINTNNNAMSDDDVEEKSEPFDAVSLYSTALKVFNWQSLGARQIELEDLSHITLRVLATGVHAKLIKKYASTDVDNSLVNLWKNILAAITSYTRILTELFQNYRNVISTYHYNDTAFYLPQSMSKIFSKVWIFVPLTMAERLASTDALDDAPTELSTLNPNMVWAPYHLDKECLAKFSHFMEINHGILEEGLLQRQVINRSYPTVRFFHTAILNSACETSQKAAPKRVHYPSDDESKTNKHFKLG